MKLSKEEKDLLKSVEDGEWLEAENLPNRKKQLEGYAKNTFKKDKRVNIRISQKDLEAIQTRALEEGLPYQTLMSSVLHKYVTRRLVEKVA